ncbi:aerobic respiration two-component sensor histidine kinase ArcB [Pseudoalteromonas sp. BDTF-M6]|uniref:aerobic respiration two-component sensor histidine kinase ArcB n=1 Tax=Pseudoalteromonas sp. BDTF-M6 TaxID=2796132 RepID=UPI001BAF6105|nr:aerobic respiration two-component sensor histidine kinase ArcB [Pseudoalteromonas sp. BDTF-M6]MBS3799041.1 aerobic respiration two-component sensor histidine kinase ArcB [Pseudoalteromonas sp. BDTF-M6]
MIDSSLSPWVRVLTNLLIRFGTWYAGAIVYGVFIVAALIFSAMYYYVAIGEIMLLDVLAVVFFTAVAAPLVIMVVLQSVAQLQDSQKYLETATKQEKLLNQSLKDNIRLLNTEIDERKMALNAKYRAIDELRREIAERKKTQVELAEQGMLLRSIVDSSPDLFYYRDRQGVFAGCNKMFEKVMNRSSDQLIGKKAEDIYPAQLLPAVLKTDRQVESTHEAVTVDVQYPVDGEQYWFEMRKLPFINDKGEYIGLLAFGRDITSRKEAEQALETAYKDKGKFIATLSHELRTPLNGIVGLTRMLLDTELSKQQRSWCNTVFSSAETLGNIFNDIIDLDKIDREQLDIVTEPVSIADFINDVVNFGSLIAAQKELSFNIERFGELNVYAQIDPTRLRQVLWNLINNAVKFTTEGGVALSCEHQQQGDNHSLILTVRDSGIGIPDDQLSHIFDMYYKAPDASGANAIGSGIGLAVTKALVTAMDGDIQVTSQKGEGSIFTVSIPLQLTSAPVIESYECKSLNILLVEDVPLNAEIATNLLEQRGHEVIWAETGEDALAFVETEDDLDLVLLDMQLPDINGDVVAREIREQREFDHLPIVVLTANVRSAEEELEGINIQGALAKPINTAKLDNMLSKLFGIGQGCMQQVAAERLVHQQTVVPPLALDERLLDQEIIGEFLDSMGVTAFSRSVALFAKLAPGYQQELVASVEDDVEEYKSVAHKLKGAAGSVGLKAVQLQAKKMENQCLEVAPEQRQSWLDELDEQIKEGLEALQSFLSNLADD